MIPSSAIDFRIPEEDWAGHEVPIHNLKVFGSKCVVQVPKQKRRKLDNVGEQGTFVGYSERQKGYRILLQNNTVIVERNVKVFERCDNNQGDHSRRGPQRGVVTPVSLDLLDTSEYEDDNEGNDPEDRRPGSESDYNSADPGEEDYEVTEAQSGDAVGNGAVSVAPRRSERIPKPLMRPEYEYTYMCHVEPTNYKEAVQCKEQKEWQSAMEKEIASLKEYNTWDLVPRP